MIDRRTWSAGMLGAAAWPAWAGSDASNERSSASLSGNILRVPFEAAETGFDPVKVGDLYSNRINSHIFEALYRYDPLAVPVKIRPLTALALPQVSSDYRTWTITLQRGIHFADDPVFKGRKRELVAEDYAYSIKRFFDPANKSPAYSSWEQDGVVGLTELRERALREKRPFDYDTPVEGVRALDRYTLQIKLKTARPRFILGLCSSATMGAVAREVIEGYADTMAHPVGTGPYRLKEWRRSSRIVLERNRDYRPVFYDAEPNADDAQGQAWLARYGGRRLPFNDGVEIVVIDEGQPRWLSFLNGQVDFVRVPPEFSSYAMPNGRLAPMLAKRSVHARRYVNSDYTMSWFNMDDPVVGGYTPEKVALRRAISLAYNIEREIHGARRGSAIRAQAPMPPGTFGYDPHYRSENSAYDPARAKALLDIYGYVDRDGDGWRELPDGRPLVLEMATQASYIERQFDEIWQKSLAAIGVRIKFNTAQWPENMKAARAGKLQMWSLGSTATTPDAEGALEYMYGPSIGSANLARFKLPAFDAIYERITALPDGPERVALFLEASKLVTAYMPYRIHVHRVYNDLSHPWITGFRQTFFRNEIWQYVEVDAEMRERMTGA
jgi:ABC-type transport system substrate-binding protein